ncbi:WD40-repeat-containing domain protein [Melanogaster broomeanus]|nr:WD40-repeat-containing domain protein [Melanogaster broomeanus]
MPTSSQSGSLDSASKRVPVQAFEGHESLVGCLCFYPDGNKLVSGSYDSTVRIWDRKTGAVEVLSGHTTSVHAVDVSQDGKMVVSGGSDYTVRIWNGDSGETIHVCEGHKNYVSSVHFSPDVDRVVSGSADGTVRVWSVETGELAFEEIECYEEIECVRFSPSGDRIASAAATGRIQIWNPDTGNSILSIEDSWVASLAWTPDSERILGGIDDGKGDPPFKFNVAIWNSRTGDLVRTWKTHDDWNRLSLSPTGTHLAICASNGEVKKAFVFDISIGEQVAAFEHDQGVRAIAYSPSGFITTGSLDNKVYLWEGPDFEDPKTKVSSCIDHFLNELTTQPTSRPHNSSHHSLIYRQFHCQLERHETMDGVFKGSGKVCPMLTSLFTRGPATVTHTVRPVQVAAGKDRAYWLIIAPARYDTPMRKFLYTIVYCQKPPVDDEEESENPDATTDPSHAPASTSVITNQPESHKMNPHPSSVPSDIPEHSTVSGHSSLQHQPTPSTDPLSITVALDASCAPSSSAPAVVSTSTQLSASENTRPTSTQPLPQHVDIRVATTLSLPEMALIQEFRRFQATSVVMQTVVQPPSSPVHYESSGYPEPSTSRRQSQSSVTPISSAILTPSSPQLPMDARPSSPAVTSDPFLNATPTLPVSSLPSHLPEQTVTDTQPSDVMLCVDDTPEPGLESATEHAMHQLKNTEEDGRSFGNHVFQLEFENPWQDN